MKKDNNRLLLFKIYSLLYKLYGPLSWWPADDDFEVAIGAILTQNTNWQNVEKAVSNLKNARVLNAVSLHKIRQKDLARLIRPCGYYNIKAKRLKNFIDYLFLEYSGKLRNMRSKPITRLREGLLSINGIGPETADSIILYAVKRAVFVIDAYTRRIVTCLRLIGPGASYDEMQALFESNLPRRVELFNEYHALLVEHAKRICKSRPACSACILHSLKKR